MTFDTEIQKTTTEPINELYELITPANTYRFTSNRDKVLFNGFDYEPSAIERGTFTRETQLKEVTISLTAKITEATASYLMNAPAITTDVRVYRAFIHDPSLFRLIFNGTITRVNFENLVATAVCKSLSKLRRAKLPRLVYQSTCNHLLFDSGCGLNENSFKVTAVLDSVNANVITSSAFSAYPDGYFLVGKVEFQPGLSRLVIKHVGNTITLQQPFNSAVTAGVTVTARPGCDRRANTCLTKFSNLQNFLGFPYIPSTNPILWPFR